MKQVNFVLGTDNIFNTSGPWVSNVNISSIDNVPSSPYIFVTGLSLKNMNNLLDQFTKEPGLLINEGATDEIMQDLRESRAHCMINIYAEAWMDAGLIEPMQAYFTRMRIPLSQIIWHTNCANHAAMYDKIVTGDRINTSYLPFFIHDYTHHYGPHEEFRSDPDKHIVKPFLCFNYHHHKHRVEFFARAVKAGLFDDFYWSLPRDGYRGTYQEAMEFYFPNIDQGTVKGLTYADVVQAQAHLPQVLEPNFDRGQQENGVLAPQLYSSSLLSVVTETFFHREEIHLTEKIFKAITWRHPFVLVATPGSLAYLHTLGFKTFHAFWDESYDLELCHEQRMNKIIQQLKTIASWNTQQQRDFLVKIQPLIKHNAQTMAQLCEQTAQGKNKEYVEFLEKYGQET